MHLSVYRFSIESYFIWKFPAYSDNSKFNFLYYRNWCNLILNNLLSWQTKVFGRFPTEFIERLDTEVRFCQMWPIRGLDILQLINEVLGICPSLVWVTHSFWTTIIDIVNINLLGTPSKKKNVIFSDIVTIAFDPLPP